MMVNIRESTINKSDELFDEISTALIVINCRLEGGDRSFRSITAEGERIGKLYIDLINGETVIIDTFSSFIKPALCIAEILKEETGLEVIIEV